MIVALLHHKGGVGKTTLALHLAGEFASRGKRVTSAAARACRAPSASSAWRATRYIAKRLSWPAMRITSSSTGRRASPA